MRRCCAQLTAIWPDLPRRRTCERTPHHGESSPRWWAKGTTSIHRTRPALLRTGWPARGTIPGTVHALPLLKPTPHLLQRSVGVRTVRAHPTIWCTAPVQTCRIHTAMCAPCAHRARPR
jgi:hypothetical protein